MVEPSDEAPLVTSIEVQASMEEGDENIKYSEKRKITAVFFRFICLLLIELSRQSFYHIFRKNAF